MSQENANNKPLIRYVNRQPMSWRAVDAGTVDWRRPSRAGDLDIGRALGLELILSGHRKQHPEKVGVRRSIRNY
jgi:hypothetical protein